MWELPAKVYARPLELFAGARLDADELAYELEILGYRKVTTPRGPGQVARNRSRFEIHTRGFDFPGERESARRVLVELGGGRVKGLSAAGGSIDLMRLDPVQIGGIYPSHGEDRVLVQLADVPQTLREGLIAVEDHRFYDHRGFFLYRHRPSRLQQPALGPGSSWRQHHHPAVGEELLSDAGAHHRAQVD